MAFDPKIHDVKTIIIKCGRLLHPEEKNISKLYLETSERLGVPVIVTHTGMKFDEAQNTITNPGISFQLPTKDCPRCNSEKSMILAPICRTCNDSENGKFKSAWICSKAACKYRERSEKAFVKWLVDLGVEIPQGEKEKFGIKTLTDDGLK